MPSSRIVGRISASSSRVHSEYSVCSAVIGCVAWARRIVSGFASLRPMWRILPAATCSAERADRLLDRDVRVHAVLVVEVDVVDAEPLQRAVERPAHVLGAAVEPAVAVLVDDDSELGRELDLVAAIGDRLADELLVLAHAVHLGRVEEGDAELERPVDRRDRLCRRRARRRRRTCPCSRGRAPRPRSAASSVPRVRFSMVSFRRGGWGVPFTVGVAARSKSSLAARYEQRLTSSALQHLSW